MADTASLQRELERNHRYLQFLVLAGDILGRSLRYEETLRAICRAAVQSIADLCLVDIGSSVHTLHLAAAARRDDESDEELDTAGRFLRSVAGYPNHPVVEVMRTGVPHLAAEIDDAYVDAHASSPQHADFMRRHGYRSKIVVPLQMPAGQVLGTLSLVRTTESEERYDALTLSFAVELGRRCAMAVDRANAYEQREMIASRFQLAALPSSVPQVENVAFDGFYEPSSHELLVGGDWYDAFVLPDQRIAITIGDVLGHGIDAAVWMSRMRNGLRAALLADPDPARALAIADQLLRLESGEQFTTAIIGILDPERLTLTCASAGHPGPLLWDADGAGVIDPFFERGIPLGLHGFERGLVASQTVTLYPGALAVFFTDGLLEWKRDIESAWNALRSAIADHAVREADHPAFAIRQAVIGRGRHADDVAILTVRCERRV